MIGARLRSLVRSRPQRPSPYYSLTAEVAAAASETLQDLLQSTGASGLEIRDAETLPMPGVRAPRIGCAMVIAFFDRRALAHLALAQVTRDLVGARCKIRSVPTFDWSRRWKNRTRSHCVGRVWVGPPWQAPPRGFQGVKVAIEPRMVFGTGDHPTTLLCLEALDDYLRRHPHASVLDVGTGTGVLAIAANRLGAKRIVALDNDPHCIAAARENCRDNGALRVRVSGSSVDHLRGRFDLVLANIAANTLIDLGSSLRRKVGQRLVLSGLLPAQRSEVEAAYRRDGFTVCDVRKRGDWLRLDLQPF